MIWSLIQRLGKEAVNTSFMLWLAYVLVPEDFGALAICLVWLGLAKLFIDLGFPLAIIRMKNPTTQHLSSFFFFNLIAGLILYATFGVTLYYTDIITSTDKYRFVYLILASTIVIDSASTVFRTILQKNLLFKRLAYRDITASLLSGIVGVSLAHNDFEVWSLVGQSITISAVGTIILWRESDWRPNLFEASLSSLKDLWGFASSMTAAEILKYLSQNYQVLTIGYLLDQRMTGLFVFSWKFSILVFKEPVKAIDAYLFPRFSMEKDNIDTLRHLYIDTIKTLAYLAFPAIVLYATTFPQLLLTFYGDQWAETAVLIQILSVAAFSYVYITVSTSLKKALGRGKWIIVWIIYFVGAMIIAIGIGHFWGLYGVVIAVSTIHTIGVLFAVQAAMKELDINLGSIVSELGPLVGLKLGSLLLISITLLLLADHNVTGPAINIAVTTISLAVYFYVAHFLNPKLNYKIWNRIKASFNTTKRRQKMVE